METNAVPLEVEILIINIGSRIFDDYNNGFWSYDVAEASLETLSSLIGDHTWLGMPIIPEPEVL